MPVTTEHAGTILGVVLMEFGGFAMMRRMLRGIKTRAESISDNHAPSRR